MKDFLLLSAIRFFLSSTAYELMLLTWPTCPIKKRLKRMEISINQMDFHRNGGAQKI